MLGFNWSELWTASEAEKELKGFKFKGPGWYCTKTDTMLVIPVHRETEALFDPDSLSGEKFRFYVWNGPNRKREIKDILRQITLAPER